MRIHDFVFVALVAFGSGWTLAAIALDLMAGTDSRSVLWLACSRFFLALACVAFAVAAARAVWHSRRLWLESGWRLAATSIVLGLPLVAVSLGHVVSAWIGVALAIGAGFAYSHFRTGGVS